MSNYAERLLKENIELKEEINNLKRCIWRPYAMGDTLEKVVALIGSEEKEREYFMGKTYREFKGGE